MKIHYQSFVDEASASGYWAKLNAFLNANASEGTEVIMHGVTPHESYAHGLVEYRCGRRQLRPLSRQIDKALTDIFWVISKTPASTKRAPLRPSL